MTAVAALLTLPLRGKLPGDNGAINQADVSIPSFADLLSDRTMPSDRIAADVLTPRTGVAPVDIPATKPLADTVSAVQQHVIAGLPTAPVAIPFLATDIFGRSVVLPENTNFDQRSFLSNGTTAGVVDDGSTPLGIRRQSTSTSQDHAEVGGDVLTTPPATTPMSNPLAFPFEVLGSTSIGESPETTLGVRPDLTGAAPPLPLTTGLASGRAAPEVDPLPAPKPAATVSSNAEAQAARFAALDDQRLAINLTLHHAEQAVELIARVAGAPDAEAELARVAEQVIAQSGLQLSRVVVNGRRANRPPRR